MPHTIEPASSGRAKCRGCDQKIPKDELRLGERLENPFSDKGEMTLWFHLRCGAFKRPEVMLEALADGFEEIADRDSLIAEAEIGRDHHRLPRFDGAERAKSGRAKCRHCHEKIDKDAWRFRLVFYEEGRFEPSGTIHVRCASEYLDYADLGSRIRHFAPQLSDADVVEIEGELAAGQ